MRWRPESASRATTRRADPWKSSSSAPGCGAAGANGVVLGLVGLSTTDKWPIEPETAAVFAMFLLLSYLPQLGRWLPKPGAWMERFREFLDEIDPDDFAGQ